MKNFLLSLLLLLPPLRFSTLHVESYRITIRFSRIEKEAKKKKKKADERMRTRRRYGGRRID